MKYLKKALKFLFLLLFIILASVGVGIAGGIPPALGSRKRDHDAAARIELFEKKTKEDQQAEILEVN